jgi:hypothetical protein
MLLEAISVRRSFLLLDSFGVEEIKTLISSEVMAGNSIIAFCT